MAAKERTNFRLLLDIFKSRFLENDAEGSFEINLYQLIGSIATPGLFVSLFSMPVYMELKYQAPGPEVAWTLRTSHMFFPVYAFAVTMFATVFEWDVLFPDRRDFLILAPFPIRLRELFSAKCAALGLFLLALTAPVHLFPTLTVPLFSAEIPQLGAAGFPRLLAAQIAATAGASAFAFFLVAGLQGLLINMTNPAVFRRISPAVQMLGMSAAIISLMTYPLSIVLLRIVANIHPGWLYFVPAVWFTAFYDLLLPGGDPQFVGLAIFGAEALLVAIGVFALSWGLGFRRHYRRTLESEDTSSRVRRISPMGRWIRSPEERAIFDFSGRILARSTKHRLFLAAYLSVGVAVGILSTVMVMAGKIGLSRDGLRSFPFLIAFFVVSGFRAALQFPAELNSNWVFRITESAWAEVSRSATRKRVLAGGLVPALILIFPFEAWTWGWRLGPLHILCQLAGGALLIEALFWTFDKVPFTCSYFPGKVNLALLSAFYLYGFTTYSFHMADLESTIDTHATTAAWFFGISAILLAICWRRHPAAAAVRFDASEPEIQVLDLT